MSAWARPGSAGKRGDALEQFGFEELAAARDHKAYLWGNPQMACVLLIGRTFIERGWDTEPGDELDVRDLPAHDGVARCRSKALGRIASSRLLTHFWPPRLECSLQKMEDRARGASE